MFHSLPLSLVPCLSRASSLSLCLSRSLPLLLQCNPNPRRRDPFPLSLFSVLWSLDPLSFLPNSAALPLRLLPSQRPASCVCGNPHGLIRKYGLMCCRQCFRSNAKEIGFIKISIQTSTSAGLEQTLPWIFYHKIELRRAYNCEIMLTKVKIPLPDLMVS
ncbi:hypothetical protein COP2_003645 [Malus domestica]